MSKFTVCFMKFFPAEHKYDGDAVSREVKRLLKNISAGLCLASAILLLSGCGEAEYKKGLKAERIEDYEGAVKWYRKAAECGHAEAQSNLGHIYIVAPNYISCEEAEKWLKKAARSGDKLARLSAESTLRAIASMKGAEASRKELAKRLGMKESDL